MKKLILASKSPRRHEILNTAGFCHDVFVSDADESVPGGITCKEAVKLISQKKVESVLETVKNEYSLEKFPEGFVIVAADTVVDVDGVMFGKPKDKDDAERMLRSLSGRGHCVHTGITVTDGVKTVSDTVTTVVNMRSLNDEEIRDYVKGEEVLDKAGAYAIQSKAGAFVRSIEGDYFNVVGLPLCRTTEILSDFGIKLFH